MSRIATPWDIVKDIQRRSEQVRSLDVDAAIRQLGPLEHWHMVGIFGEPGWMSGWHSAGSPWHDPAFFLDSGGFVHMRGVATGGTDLPMFVLPSGYRPISTYLVPAAGQNTGGAFFSAAARIDPDGLVSGNGVVLQSLDGISFRIT